VAPLEDFSISIRAMNESLWKEWETRFIAMDEFSDNSNSTNDDGEQLDLIKLKHAQPQSARHSS
jgi:hypothetical protein